MGCTLPNDGFCSMATINSVNDAQPVHRVYVDGFWMDKTDVTNDEFEKFVQRHGLQDHRRDRADAGTVSHRAAGKSCGRLHSLHAHDKRRAAE